MKYSLGILLAATKDSAFTIGTLLINIKDKMDISQTIFYIINDGFSQNDKSIMQELVPNIKFINFTIDDFETNIRKFNADFKLNKQNPILNRYTHMTYARFEALKFLKECENIIYLDFDMLLLKGIDELKEIKNKGYEIACFRGSATMSMGGGVSLLLYNSLTPIIIQQVSLSLTIILKVLKNFMTLFINLSLKMKIIFLKSSLVISFYSLYTY